MNPLLLREGKFLQEDIMEHKNDNETISRIRTVREQLGEKLIILTHNYQRKQIMDLGDFKGDSFDLSQKAAAHGNAEYIVFCGVHFMAESAAILAQPHQIVQIPDEEAGCRMADMADMMLVEKAWREITSVSGKDGVLPVVYMNSDAELKAFCGKKGGLVCTSSNAPAAFGWGFQQRSKILFLPDQHLGRNTGNRLGISSFEMILWNPHKPFGGNTTEAVQNSRLILWDGYCPTHMTFTVDQIHNERQEHSNAEIVVHPECTQEVVAMADAVGSTSYIVKYVENAPVGATIIIGTEINLVDRLALEFPEKTILPLQRSLCPNMFRISPEKLLYTLENIGKHNVVTIPEDLKAAAKLALDRMLNLTFNS